MACFLHWKLHGLLPDGRPVFLWSLSNLDLHFMLIRSYQIFAFNKGKKRNQIYLELQFSFVVIQTMAVFSSRKVLSSSVIPEGESH